MFEDAYSKISNVNLWLKVQSGDPIVMSDVPQLISLRWTQFRDKWDFIASDVLRAAQTNSIDPDALKTQFDDFSNFISTQRALPISFNPLSDTATVMRFSLLFDVMPLTIIPLTNEETRLVTQAIDRVKQYTKQDFMAIRAQIEKTRDEYADVVDTTDDDYNRIFLRSAKPSQISASVNDMQLLQYLQNGVHVVDFILANILSLNTVSVDPFLLARINANNPDISIQQYASGKLVKLNYGEDLAALAARTLGNADRWIEIAIANGLKPPYIDEIGMRVFLASNAAANQVNIAAIDGDGNSLIDRLFVNQIVTLQSDTQPLLDMRAIISIKVVPVSGDIILELGGISDLSRYKVSENANIRIFKPNTVNSDLYVLIPSNDPVDPDVFQETPWFLKTSDSDEKLAKVDLALSDTADLQLTSYSDLSLSYSISNAIQAIQLKLAIELGELSRHPEYGLQSVVGRRNINVGQLKQTLATSIHSQIAADSRFAGLKQLSIEYINITNDRLNPSSFIVQLVVQMAGSDTAIPISFSVTV